MALPAAVAVEVFGAGHLGRNVTRRGAAFVCAIFARHPVGKRIAGHAAPGITQAGARAALAPQLGPLAAFDDETFGVIDAQGAAPDAGVRGVVDAVETVVAGAHRAQAYLGRVYLELGGQFARAHTQRQAAGVQLKAHVLIVQSQHFEFGAGGQPQHG